MNNKKLISLILSAALIAVLPFSLVACSAPAGNGAVSKEATAASNADSSKKSDAGTSEKPLVYTTFYPVYDLTKRIVGDKMNVKMLIKTSEEPHDFELKASDMQDLLKADLIVYNGAGMENFIPTLKNSMKKDERFLDLSQGLTLLENKSDLDDGKHEAVNPHTWLSVKNAMEQLDTIYRKISSIDHQNNDYYKANLEKSLKEFKALDEKFTTELGKIKKKDKYFIVSHAAFNYLANDYGLKQIAVTGISPEDEPTAAQLKKIADFVKQHGIKTILFEGKATPKVAKTLADNTGAKTGTIYTLENLTPEETELGYIKLMELNLQTLATVLAE